MRTKLQIFTAQVARLDLRVGGHSVFSLHSSNEPGLVGWSRVKRPTRHNKLIGHFGSGWTRRTLAMTGHDDSTISIVVVISTGSTEVVSTSPYYRNMLCRQLQQVAAVKVLNGRMAAVTWRITLAHAGYSLHSTMSREMPSNCFFP